MEEKTLRQIYNEYGIPRRAVQGYEQAGLVHPTGTTNKGYLLYDEETVKRIRLIRNCQSLGFKVKEIGGFLAAEPAEQRKVLRERLESLNERKENIDRAIQMAEEMIQKLS